MTNDTKKVPLKLSSVILKHKWKYILGVIFIGGINLLQIKIPQVQGNVIDLLIGKNIIESDLFRYAGIIMLLAVGAFISRFLSRLLLLGTSSLIDYELRNDMFGHLVNMSMKFFNKNSTGEIMALATNDLGTIRMALSRGIMMSAHILLLFIFAFMQMSGVSLKLTALTILPFPLLLFIIIKYGPLIRKRFSVVQESFADLSKTVQENLSAIRVIKAFVREDAEIENFTEHNDTNYNAHMKLVKLDSIFFPIINFIGTLSIFILLLFGGSMVIKGEITLGQFIACNTYVAMLVRPVMMIGMIIGILQRSSASWKRVVTLLTAQPDIVDNVTEPEFRKTHNMTEDQMLSGEIEFKNLSFSYADEDAVLKNINLKIKKGTSLGIVGRIGSGKTTLINLIMRLYEVTDESSLYLDGIDIKNIPQSVLHKSIGYVPQDHFLFSDTIANNIDFNVNPMGMDAIIEAARTSQIHDSILEFREQYDTKLGERGVTVSGGQKQRISIARAIIREPSILIMDDCLSAVDTATEEKILEDLKPFMANRTSIIIGHRISSIQNSDHIIVLDEGRIIEQGNHAELLAINGLYKKMFNRQQLEAAIEEI